MLRPQAGGVVPEPVVAPALDGAEHTRRPGSSPPADEHLMAHVSELAKLEEQRVQNLDNQATAIVSVVLAVAAFSASALDGQVLAQVPLAVALVGTFTSLTVLFAVGARSPRAVRTRFWTTFDVRYAALEQRLAAIEELIGGDPPDVTRAVLESWRARRAVAAHIAEGKALWVSYSLACLLCAFVTAVAAAVVVAA